LESRQVLPSTVADHLDLDPFSGHVFAFCNRGQTTIKILYWDRNGFFLWQKRLEKHRFAWPQSEAHVLDLNSRQLAWLLDGLDPLTVKAHKKLEYSCLTLLKKMLTKYFRSMYVLPCATEKPSKHF